MANEPPDQPRSAVTDGGAGGKISTNRSRRRFNPYDRLPPPQPQSPSWLSGVVPTSRKFASGAVKILSSVFISDSSSSVSSDDEDSISEDDVDNDNYRDGHLNETNGSNLEAERKHVIMQLLLQETFSREERDILVNIIHSRVLEHSSEDRGKMVDSTLVPIRSGLNVTPDHAVMEAKKFLEEKKAGQSPQSDFGHGSSGLYSAMIQHIESEAGSPADLAISYMQGRLPWASPSTGKFELRTPSTILTQLASEEKLHSVRENSVTHLKERKYLASEAWIMQDEIRRVRSKATEDMLRPLSLPTVGIPRDKVSTFTSSAETKILDRPAKLAAGAGCISASDIREGVTIEASLPSHATFDPEQKHDLEANQNLPEHTVSDHSVIPDHAAELADPNFSSRNSSKGVNVKEPALLQNSETQKANGVPPSTASLSEGVRENQGLTNDFLAGYKWELLSEVSVEVPTAHDTVNVESGSQHSHEELSQEQSETEGNHRVAVKPDGTGMNQQGKNPVRRQPKRQKAAA